MLHLKILFYSYIILSAACANVSLMIGYAVDYTTGWPMGINMAPAIIQGIREVQHRHLLDGYKIEWTWRDTWCEPLQAIRMAVDMKSNTDHLDVIIGEACSDACKPIGLLAAAWAIPFVTMGCLSPLLSDRKTYPTVSRVIGTTSATGPAYNGLADLMNWDRVAIIYDYSDIYRSMAEAASNSMESAGKTVLMRSIANTMNAGQVIKDKYNMLVKVMSDMKELTRVLYLFLTSPDRRNTLIIAQDLGMMNGEYAFVTSAVGQEIRETFSYRPEIGPEIFIGVLNRDTMEPEGEQWTRFAKQVIKDFDHPAFANMPHPPPGSGPEIINVYAGMVHDAVLAWAYGVNKTISQGFSPTNGVKVTENINSLTFEGITGTVATNYYGERIPSYKVEIIQKDELVKIMEWIPTTGRMVKVYKPHDPNDWRGLVWSGNASRPPNGKAACGWVNELCQHKGNKNIIIWLFISITLLIAIPTVSGIIYWWRKYRSPAASCCVSWSEIEHDEQGTRTSSSSLRSSLTAASQPRHHMDLGRLRGDLVVIKHLGFVKISDVQITQQLKALMQMKHENLNPFVGICLEVPHACVLMLYAPRGSLQDIIGDERVNLIWDLKVSLSADIANGMKFIHHSLLGYHGNLTSSKCIVDSRWICKITDYGLDSIKKLSGLSQDEPLPAKLLWKAPEILRDSVVNHKLADIYSFGIILYEILVEAEPYTINTGDLELSDIINKVRDGKPPLRPSIPEGACSSEWSNLITMCWKEDAKQRPSSDSLVNYIGQLSKGKNQTLVDDMISRLERQTEFLEKIVAERSSQLEEEKNKMEILLAELLPSSVAESLKHGYQVAPEAFDNVTIFLSDIVSFTNIASKGTPLDVVRMLNIMYTVFDEVSAQYDVYKIATIGDAYLVASGVPIRNGDSHAREICRMALHLLTSIGQCSIPHIAGGTLQIRIGVHSGPCVAGVTGLKMPRYLLFGDAVDFAAKMESSGDSMKVHVSQYTANILNKIGGFHLEPSSCPIMKGGEDIKTFWLIGMANTS